MYLGLGQRQALECFDFSMAGPQVVTRGRKTPTVIEEAATYRTEALIRYADTSCFAVNRHCLAGGSMVLKHAPAILIVTQGEGVLSKAGYRQAVKKGDYFFLPFAAQGTTTIATETGLELIECLPSQRPI
jgi:mannose-6-phosphate isomerase